MTGQMPDIINRIDALKYKAWALLGKEPNTIYMSITDYRQLCEAAKDWWLPRSTRPAYCTGVPLEKKSSDARPTQIMLMRIVKRAGEMECAFASPVIEKPVAATCVHDNDFMTCAKCIPPIAKREFGEPRELLAEWFKRTGFTF